MNGFLAGVLLAFDPTRGDLNSSYRIEIDGRRFEFAVSDGHLAAAHSTPTVTVTVAAADLLTARFGPSAAQRAAALRRLDFDGEPDAVEALRNVFHLSDEPDVPV